MAKPLKATVDGGGEALAVKFDSRRDIHLFRRAIIERWPMTAEAMQAGMSALRRIIGESDDDRAVVAATSALIAADKANVAAYLAALKEVNGEGTTNNTQINNTIDLSGLTVEQLKALAGRDGE